MRKIIPIIICLVLVLALVSCDKDNPTTAPVTSEPTAEPTTAPVTSEPTAEPTTAPVTSEPTAEPTTTPVTSEPTAEPTTAPVTSEPTAEPTTTPVTSEPTAEPTTTPVTSEPTAEPTETSEPCAHSETHTVGAKDATCTENGYTGDTVCSACGEIITAGEIIPAFGHTTSVVGFVEPASCAAPGYSGDTVCSVCGMTVAYGTTLYGNHTSAKKIVGHVEPTASSEGYTGDTVCPDCGYMYHQGRSIPAVVVDSHRNTTLEMMMLDAINAERAKVGLYPYTWNESMYKYAKIRSKEASQLWAHVRPDGTPYYTAIPAEYYSTNNNRPILFGLAENLAFITSDENAPLSEIVAASMDTLMKSKDHKAAILSPISEQVAVALYFAKLDGYDNVYGYFTAQLFTCYNYGQAENEVNFWQGQW